MKILFLGLGSIGRKHALIINKLFPQYQLVAFRQTDTVHNLSYIIDLYLWEDVEKLRPDICFICNPTYRHISTAIQCAKLNSHLFIEKPICSNFVDFFRLLDIVYQRDLVAYVAYPFRFHIGLKRRFDEIRMFAINQGNIKIVARTNMDLWGKKSYSFEKKKGGGVIFELSHELDLAKWLFGDIERHHCSYFNFKDGINKSCGIKLYHRSGIVSDVHLSLNSDIEERYIEYSGIRYDYQSADQMYFDQLRYFFENIGNPKLTNNIFEASGLFYRILQMEGAI